jgi:Rrf2 family transcriptional regulator, cysteine metabolism repressor
MRLSRKSEYACLAMIDLAEHSGGPHVKIREIAERQGIPREFLVQILLRLKSAGYVRSARGAAGGYQLAKEPEAISVAEVVRLLDGPLAPVVSASKFFYQGTPVEKHPNLLRVFREIRDYASRRLEATSFADLARKPRRRSS